MEQKIELTKQHVPIHFAIIMGLIVVHFLVMLYAFTDITRQLDQLFYKIDAFRTPVHNGITSMAFGKRTNMFTVVSGNLYLMVPLPVTADSGIVEIIDEEDGRKIEKKVKVKK